jgi:hypothetical protein
VTVRPMPTRPNVGAAFRRPKYSETGQMHAPNGSGPRIAVGTGILAATSGTVDEHVGHLMDCGTLQTFPEGVVCEEY